MKLTTVDSGIESGGVVQTGSFSIKATGKAFAILSSGLYTNKILAVIRELSCNAYDAHVANGNPNEQFTVKMPNRLDLTFGIRDYGIGLPHEKVMKLYTTYFESTKTDSNDFIGALGLGSKSPFSYTQSFTVEAFFNGRRGVYNAHIGKDGMPAITLMMEEPTEERNGLRVSFPVKEQDINSFVKEAENVFRYFRTRPEIVGTELNIKPVEYLKSSEENRWGYRNATHDHYYQQSTPRAVMGNVAYPLTTGGLPLDAHDTSDADERIRRLKASKVLNAPFDLYFDIGELDITASREALSYDEPTINAIINRAVAVFDDIVAATSREIDAIDNIWDATIYLDKLSQRSHDSHAYSNFLRGMSDTLRENSTAHAGHTFMQWRGQPVKDFTFSVGRGVFENGFSFRVIQSKTTRYGHFKDFILKNGAQSIIGLTSIGAFGNVELGMRVRPTNTLAVYVNDQGLAGLARIRRQFTTKHRTIESGEYAIIVTYEPALERALKNRIDADPTQMEDVVKKFLTSINYDVTKVVYASQIQLPKEVEAQIVAEVTPKKRTYVRVKTSGLFAFDPYHTNTGELGSRLSWNEVESLEDQQRFSQEGGFFVYLDGYTPMMSAKKVGKEVVMEDEITLRQLKTIIDLMKTMGLLKRGETVYGVRRSFMKAMGSKPTSLKTVGPQLKKHFDKYIADYQAIRSELDVHSSMDNQTKMVYNLLTEEKMAPVLKKQLKDGDIAVAYQQLRDYTIFRSRAEGRLGKLNLQEHHLDRDFDQGIRVASSVLGFEVSHAKAAETYRGVRDGVVKSLGTIAQKYPLMMVPMTRLNKDVIGHVVQYVKMVDTNGVTAKRTA